MKKTMNVLLAMMLSLGLCGCGSTAAVQEPEDTESSAETETETEEEEHVVQEEETVDDPTWDMLNSLGMVETENGLFYVTITLPADFVGEGVTQESVDAAAGDTYTSGKVNEDGSVTYKMTKKQHKAMLDEMAGSIDESLKELTTSGEYGFSEITHNSDFTVFDVKLTTEELGFTEGFMVMAFYMYGGMYSIFTGKKSDVQVNIYSSSGELIETANSADVGE